MKHEDDEEFDDRVISSGADYSGYSDGYYKHFSGLTDNLGLVNFWTELANDLFLSYPLMDVKLEKQPENFLEEKEEYTVVYPAVRQPVIKTDSDGFDENASFHTEPMTGRIIHQGTATIVILKCGEHNGKGVAKCHVKDIFSRREGVKTAYKRALIDLFTNQVGKESK